MEIEKKRLDEIHPYAGNAKLHPAEQVEQIKKSIEQFGNNDPIAIDEEGVIIEGHGRYLALKELGYDEAEVIVLKGMTEDEKNAYRLVHNQLTMNSGFDLELLEEELKAIDIDLEDYGISLEDFDIEEKPIVEDEPPEVDEDNPPQSVMGGLYKLGNHFLMCGDSTNEEDVRKLMSASGETVLADLVFTDPPYNVNYSRADGSRAGEIENDDFETDEEAKDKLWKPAFANMRKFSNDCCAFYVCMPQGGTHMMMMMMALTEAGWKVKHELIWEKQSIVFNRADYNYQHEPICYGWNKTHHFQGKGEFHNTSIWKIDRPTVSKMHPTMKPINLICEALQDNSVSGNSVIDLFGGSGSTLIACEQLGRKCYMMELSEKYCDVIIKRWENLTGLKAEKIA